MEMRGPLIMANIMRINSCTKRANHLNGYILIAPTRSFRGEKDLDLNRKIQKKSVNGIHRRF